jgi:tight adherence protein B
MSTQLIVVWCAALSAVAAVVLLRRQDKALRRARLMFADAGRTDEVPREGIRRQAYGGLVRAALVAAVGRGRGRLEDRLGLRIGPEAFCAPAGLVLALAAHSPVPVLAGLLATPFVRRQLRLRAGRLESGRWEEAVTGLCASVAGELRAGRPPEAALVQAVERLRGAGTAAEADAVLTPLLAAARFGGDVPAAIRQVAGAPGARGLAGAAACWEVAVDGGAGLADGLDRVAAALRAERDQREDLAAQLAGPRSTAVILALLPAFGVLLGIALGADPLRVLLHTPAGLGCLLVGVALEWAGLAWTSRIVRAAQVPS